MAGKKRQRCIVGLAGAAIVALCVPSAHGLSLMTDPYETQLETWLGGDYAFTLVYDSLVDGLEARDFHANADNMGPTITLVEVMRTQGNRHQIIGGYDPRSWDKTSGYVSTPDLEDRTAFIFNLYLGTQYMQNDDPYAGQWQTLNNSVYGPTFGGGHDLLVKSIRGEAKQYSYGSGGINVFGNAGVTAFDVARVETYTIVPVQSGEASLPEPGTAGLLGMAILFLAVRRRRR